MKYISLRWYLYSLLALNWIVGVLCIDNDNVDEQISSYLQDSKYVDPSSLYYDRQSKSVKVPKTYDLGSGNDVALRDVDSHHHHCGDRSFDVFSRRLINMLISRANIKVDNNIAIGKLDIQATAEELELLKKFGEGYSSIRQIDTVISNVIQVPQISLMDEALNLTDRFAIYIYQRRIIFLSVLLIMFVIIIAFKVKLTRFRIVLLILDIVILISFAMTWWELLQEAEIKLIAQQHIYSKMPDECRQGDVGFFKSLWLFFGFDKGDCIKYFEAVMANPELKVTPLHAFSIMVTKFFLTPLSETGNYFAEFIENMTSSLPFPINIVVKLVLTLLMPIIFSSILLSLIGTSVGIKVGPLFHFYLHGRQSTPPSDSLAYDRHRIEELRSAVQGVTETLAEIKPALVNRKKSPRKIEQPEKIKETEAKKDNKSEHDSDTNSDESLEEREFEKISKKKLEDEINKSSDLELSKIEKIEVDKISQIELQSKTLNLIKKDN